MLDAMPDAMAVFGSGGACLAANQAFAIRSALHPDEAGKRRTAFSPDGICQWDIVSFPGETAGNRVKSGFLAAMSHELRTPLNAVIGFGEMLHQEALGPIGVPEYRDYAGHILRSGQHLLALINDILDFARIESGSLKLNIGPVDLGGMVRAAMDVLSQTASSAGVTLATDITDLPIVIHADEQRLRQALLNVAGNAVKFTPAGGRVSVALAAGADGGAVITVTDSGIGIADLHVASVFDVFWQADSGLDRVKAGAGIGLPLSQQLIAMHGGVLELKSRLGEGTRVTLTLPPSQNVPRWTSPRTVPI